MFQEFPYTDMHQLNLDWIIKIAKDFLDQYTHIQQLITDGEQSLQDLTSDGLQQLQEKADNLESLLQQWYDTHSQDIANQLADALADLNEWYNTHENYLDETLATNTTLFNQRAEAKAEQTIESIPDDYTDLSNKVNGVTKIIENDLSKIDYGVQLVNPLAEHYYPGKRWTANGTLANASDAEVAISISCTPGKRYCANYIGSFSYMYGDGISPTAITPVYYVVFNETTLGVFVIPSGINTLLLTLSKTTFVDPVLFKVYSSYIYKPTNFKVAYGNHVIEYPDQNKWLGYQYISFGDSITYYNNQTYTNQTKINGSLCLGYQHYIAIKTGMAISNHGVSGADSGGILTEVQNTDCSSAYMVTIMTGVNDFGRGVPVDTYKNNIASMIRKILTDNPSCRIFLLSNTYGEFTPQGAITDTYVNALKEVAETFGVPFIDNYHNNGFCPETLNRYMADSDAMTYKIHPNNNGMAIIGTQCANEILAKL